MSLEPAADTEEVIEVRGPSALFSFEGRINQRTFWKIAILNFVFGTIATLISVRAFGRQAHEISAFSVSASVILGAITAWQSAATQVKRWHDLGKSGWMALLNFVPVVNFIAFLYLGFNEGTEGPNEYGEGPHDISLL